MDALRMAAGTLDLDLAGLFEKIDIKLEAESMANLPVYFGGPVQLDRGAPDNVTLALVRR